MIKDLNLGYIPLLSSVNQLRLLKTIKQYLRGLFLYSLLDEFYIRKRHLDHLFLLGLFGGFVGIPYLFNYYHLRLLPYELKRFSPWKRRILKERDFFDHIKE